MSGPKMDEVVGAPVKIVIGGKEVEAARLPMEKQFEVFDLVMKTYGTGQGSMLMRNKSAAIAAIAAVLGIPAEEVKPSSAGELMTAFVKIWEANDFDPLYVAVAEMNKKVVGK